MVAGELSDGDGSWWEETIRGLGTGLTEIGIHPGSVDSWRALETKPLLQDCGRVIKECKIKLITYHDI